MRDSYVFYRSFAEAIESLPAETYKAVMVALNKYAMDGITPELTGIEQTIFMLAKPQIDANNRKYENGKKGAAYGKDGGRPPQEAPKQTPKEPQENPTETPPEPQEAPKQTPNANVNENENVNDNANEFARASLAPPDPTDPTDRGYPTLDWREVLAEWGAVPRAPSPGDLWRFTNRHGSELLQLLVGLPGPDFIQAIRNYREMRETPGTWWETNPDIIAWTKKHLDRFLPGNFNIQDFMKDNPGQIDWEKIVAEAEGAKT